MRNFHVLMDYTHTRSRVRMRAHVHTHTEWEPLTPTVVQRLNTSCAKHHSKQNYNITNNVSRGLHYTYLSNCTKN